ncbi:hypothetical protein ABIA00_006123 [Bradyrhizobium ottawaense]|uniref:hypothetical protein n=1 Tax=Bradyrhizobium ottawaense TaxID=931866 RepID=UPI00383635DD
MATTQSTTPTIPELVHDHRKIVALMQGSLPERVTETLRETGYDILKELAHAQPETWPEFADKAATLVG